MADDTEDEDSGSGSAQTAAPSGRSPSTAQAIFDGLTQRGVNPQVAYGALGSLMGESGRSLNSHASNPGDGADGSTSMNFGQWNAGRARNLQATAASMGLDPYSGQAGVAHLFNELDGKYSSGNYGHVLAALKNGQTTADGNNIWTRQYEVPANVDAQVRLRQAHADALAQGAAQGTLDLSKVGSFDGGQQNMPNARSFQANGALSANNLTGGSGALDMSNLDFNTPTQQPSFGDRLTRAGAALASISSPSQASALQALVDKQQKSNLSPAEQTLKKLAAMQALKKLNTPEAPTDLGATPDKLGRIMQRPDGTTYTQTVAGLDQHQEKPDEEADGIAAKDRTNYAKFTLGASQNQDTVDRAQELQQRLTQNPEIASNLGWDADIKAYIDNSQGKSTATSNFVKDLNANVNGGVLGIIQQVGGKTNIPLQKMEMNALAPNGSLNDPLTTMSVLDRLQDRARQVYTSNMSGLHNMESQYGKKMQFIDPWSGNLSTPSAYHAANMKRWDSADDENGDAYDNILVPNHKIRTGETKKPSFLQFANPTQ
jgi:hypothetical protein